MHIHIGHWKTLRVVQGHTILVYQWIKERQSNYFFGEGGGTFYNNMYGNCDSTRFIPLSFPCTFKQHNNIPAIFKMDSPNSDYRNTCYQ